MYISCVAHNYNISSIPPLLAIQDAIDTLKLGDFR
jgi:hypothetical protein